MRTNDFPPFLAALALACSVILLAMVSRADERTECRSATHCVLMKLPRWHGDLDEDDEARNVRLLTIANSIDAATDDRTERAFLLMKAWKESRLARFVDLDLPKCRDGHDGWCDSGRSFSVYQVRGISRDSSRTDAARHALAVFRRGANYCEKRGFDRWEGGVSQYARGGVHCSWIGAKERVEFMWKMAERLGRAGG